MAYPTEVSVLSGYREGSGNEGRLPVRVVATAPHNTELYRISGLQVSLQALQVVGVGDGLTIDGDNHVASLKEDVLGERAGFDANYLNAVLLEAHALLHLAGEVLHLHTEADVSARGRTCDKRICGKRGAIDFGTRASRQNHRDAG